VTGKVIDEFTGKGIKGVNVRISFQGGSRTVLTDSNGEFRSTDVEPGKLGITYMPPPPYAMPTLDKRYDHIMLERGKNLHIIKKLEYGGTIEGRVYEKNSNTPLRIDKIYLPKHFLSDMEKKDDGEYRIDQIKPGKYTLRAAIRGVGIRQINDLEIRSNDTLRLDFPIDSNALTKVVGKVTCQETGEPKEDTEVVLFLNSEQTFTYAHTNEHGEYEFLDVLPGLYSVYVRGIYKEKDPNKIITIEKEIMVMQDKTSFVNLTVDCSLEFLKLGN